MNDPPAILGVTCGQHVEFPSRCCLYRSEVLVQISSSQNPSGCWIGIGPINWQKIPPLLKILPLPIAQHNYFCVNIKMS